MAGRRLFLLLRKLNQPYKQRNAKVGSMRQIANRFVHRWNTDDSVDSICLVCYELTCTGLPLATAKEWEGIHVCPVAAIRKWNAELSHIQSQFGKSHAR
jgi:hypothetical protein